MTRFELNWAITKLAKDILNFQQEIYKDNKTKDDFYTYIEGIAKIEFKRLYWADARFEYMNRRSILIMFRLNLSHNFVTNFGLQIHVEDLVTHKTKSR